VGIEGRDKSSSLESLLFSMFYISKIFDEWVLYSRFSRNPKTPHGKRIRHILRFEIIETLRVNHFVPYELTRKLYEALAEIQPTGSVPGIFKYRVFSFSLAAAYRNLEGVVDNIDFSDVDELMTTLMYGALEVKEFIKYSVGSPGYIHQIKTDSKSRDARVTDVQSLIESSMNVQNLKLLGVPCPAFILKMPRSKGSYSEWEEILPNLTLDIKGVLGEEK